MFVSGSQYTKADLYRILNVPKDRQKGNWYTGYPEYEGNIYIFANVGIPARTGHQHDNYWDGDLFYWAAKPKSHIGQNSIQRMLNPSPGQKIHLFTRKNDRDPFTYEGMVSVKESKDTTPVRIVWQFVHYPYAILEEQDFPVADEPSTYYEGAVTRILVNKHERNPQARRDCLEFYGTYICQACGFDFEKTYGELGKEFIHVHHKNPLAAIKKTYKLNPQRDLIPLCPNCHAMVHRGSTLLSVEELKAILQTQR